MATLQQPSAANPMNNELNVEGTRLDAQASFEGLSDEEHRKTLSRLVNEGHNIIQTSKPGVIKFGFIRNDHFGTRAQIQGKVDEKPRRGEVVCVWEQPEGLKRPMKGIIIPTQPKGPKRSWDVSAAEGWEQAEQKISTWGEDSNPFPKFGEQAMMISCPISMGVVLGEMIHGTTVKRTEFEFRTITLEGKKYVYVIMRNLPVANKAALAAAPAPVVAPVPAAAPAVAPQPAAPTQVAIAPAAETMPTPKKVRPNFCSSCGSDSVQDVVEESDLNHCPKCGHQLNWR